MAYFLTFKDFIKAALLIIIICSSVVGICQEVKITNDTANILPPEQTSDSLIIATPQKKETLDAPVTYSAEDSMRFDIKEKKLYLYGTAKVNYKTINLNAAYIELDLKLNTLFATGILDSTGKEIGTPVFQENDQSFTSKAIRYNFETKKGLIQDVITQEGEGYLHGEKVKKLENDHLYIKKGKYTTCNLPDPHFYIHASKLKVIPDNKIITGPAYLVIEDVPTPLAVPFGFFPNKKGRSSGILLPQYGENNLGFFLSDGGYYMGLGEHFDLALRGDIYSFGSWGLKGTTNYKKRYKYNGLFDARYSKIIDGVKALEKVSPKEDFRIQWRHTQDPKARPNTTFSADVNAGSSSYNRYNARATTNYLNNAMQSNIAYTKGWANKPFLLTLNARHSQNTNDSSVVIKFPEATFLVNRIYPLKKKNRIGEEKWFEKIGISYTGNAQNEIAVKEYNLFKKETLDSMRNGVIHIIPISTSLKVLKYFSLNPSLNFTERWYRQTVLKSFDPASDQIKIDTVKGFTRAAESNLNANLTTKLYGMYQFKGEKIQAIRHVLTPSVGLTLKPEFNKGQEEYVSPLNPGTPIKYSIFDNGIVGQPTAGKQGLLSLTFINNLEMKVKSAKDSVNPIKKIKILENLDFGSAYNFFAEEFKMNNIFFNGRTQLFNNINLNFGGSVDPYTLDSTRKLRINEFEYDKSGKIGRFTEGRVALNFSLKSKKTVQPETTASDEEVERVLANPDAYVDFNVPWTLNVSYNLNYQRPFDSVIVTQSILFYGDLNLTEKWKIGFNSGYDVRKGEFTATSINIYRDLHCWEMRFDWVPFGFTKSYNIQINVKASVLQDLKLSRRWNNDAYFN